MEKIHDKHTHQVTLGEDAEGTVRGVHGLERRLVVHDVVPGLHEQIVVVAPSKGASWQEVLRATTKEHCRPESVYLTPAVSTDDRLTIHTVHLRPRVIRRAMEECIDGFRSAPTIARVRDERGRRGVRDKRGADNADAPTVDSAEELGEGLEFGVVERVCRARRTYETFPRFAYEPRRK